MAIITFLVVSRAARAAETPSVNHEACKEGTGTEWWHKHSTHNPKSRTTTRPPLVHRAVPDLLRSPAASETQPSVSVAPLGT
ncbi:hypothetical protein Tco_0812918 [Tanacetum coccineum]